ncbi:C45 family peptidase [Streptomyces sp. NPDC046985]|uniref:C45 family peptidase n=1 Tax=Streptomyces sp. NPDC046985 TaxID=3155377 RepID=UPI0033FFFE19
MSGAAFVRAAGAPREIGRAHGAAVAAPLRAFLDDGLARLNHLTARPVSLTELLPSIALYRAETTVRLPDLAEEVAGLAEGAGITEDEAWLLQLRREVMGRRGVPAAGDCTAYARAAPGGPPVLAQTVDQNADLDRNVAVVHVDRAGSPRRVLALSFAGLLCFMGLNSDGLAIGLNLVTDGEWRPGVPPYLAVRHLLDSAGSVDEALEVLAGLELSSSRAMMLCDREKVVFAELQRGRLRATEPARRWAVHANHYLHPDFTARDRQSASDRISSDARAAAAAAGLAALAPDAGPEEHFALLCEAPLCIADQGDIALERTVAAVVLLPAAGEMHLRPGNPNLAPTQVFRV